MYEFLRSMSDIVGIAGVVLLLLAFFALNTGRVTSGSISYQLLNLIAAWLILYSLYFHWNTPSVLIELAWIIISVVGLVRIFIKNKVD